MSKNLGAHTPSANAPQIYTPEEIVRERGGYPTCDPAPAFRYAHSAKRWRVLSGRVVPDLCRLPISAGAQHVVDRGNGKVDTSRQRSTLEDRGFTLIPYSEGPGGSYVRSFETKPEDAPAPVTTFCSAWEQASIGSPELEVDEQGLANWLEGLVKKGMISPPTLPVLRKRHTSVLRRLQEAEGKMVHGRGSLASLVAELKQELGAWETAIASVKRERGAVAIPDLDEDEIPVEPAPVSRKK